MCVKRRANSLHRGPGIASLPPIAAYQPYFSATASNVLFPFWSHDIEGGVEDVELVRVPNGRCCVTVVCRVTTSLERD